MKGFWRFALLTLLIALLPLRGWAWSVMPVSATTRTAVQADATPSPCHGHPATHEAIGALDASADSGQHHAQTCSLCDLCHAGVMAPSCWAWVQGAPPLPPPSWAVSASPGRENGDGLFRPPRP